MILVCPHCQREVIVNKRKKRVVRFKGLEDPRLVAKTKAQIKKGQQKQLINEKGGVS